MKLPKRRIRKFEKKRGISRILGGYLGKIILKIRDLMGVFKKKYSKKPVRGSNESKKISNRVWNFEDNFRVPVGDWESPRST